MTAPVSSAPSAPVGVPAWVTRLASVVVGLVIPVLAWIDPGNKLPPHAAIRWLVVLVFAVIGAAIFLVHLYHSDVHEYGWTMNAVSHAVADTEAEFQQLYPQFKADYAAAQPALAALPGVQTAIDAVSAEVTALKAKSVSSGLTPADIVAAVEQVTGMNFPRVASDPNGTAAAGTGSAETPAA
jgi:hypothetical protein